MRKPLANTKGFLLLWPETKTMRTLLLPALMILVSFASCSLPSATGPYGTSFSTPIEYNDYIIARQTSIINHILDISKTAQTDLQATEALLNQGVKLADSALLDVKGLPAFNGDSTFRNRAISMFHFYRQVFDVDYREMVAIRKKGDHITVEDVQRLDAIQARLTEEETERDKHFQNAQQEFAERNNLRLGENELQKKIDEAN